MKKYEMLREGFMFRIKALRTFGNVKKGDLGGLIKKEENLSHEGLCWVSEDARVFERAEVSGDAQVFENAMVFGSARVSGSAWVSENAEVSKPTDIKLMYLELFSGCILPEGAQVGCEFKTHEEWLELESHPAYEDQRQFERDHALLTMAIYCYLDLQDELENQGENK